MADLLSKISSYNLFNNLLPGILLVFALSKLEIVNLDDTNPFVAAFIFYFLGMLVSRVGSIFIEPAFKKLKIVEYADYSDYVAASSLDPRIEVLLEANNTYRTMVALFASIVAIAFFQKLFSYLELHSDWQFMLAFFAVALVFVCSYRKQTEFIKKRVRLSSNRGNEQNKSKGND
jgi:magnesium-transporting ATPase (P-type)